MAVSRQNHLLACAWKVPGMLSRESPNTAWRPSSQQTGEGHLIGGPGIEAAAKWICAGRVALWLWQCLETRRCICQSGRRDTLANLPHSSVVVHGKIGTQRSAQQSAIIIPNAPFILRDRLS